MNSIRHIEIVIALDAHRNFRRAAEHLGISQPALTKNLAHIEKMLGVKLFERAGSISPTVFGEIVIARGQSVLDRFEELLREIQLTQSLETGQLSISAGLYPAAISAQAAIGALSSSHPSISCALAVKNWVDVIDDVLAARSDLGFADITEAEKNPALETEPVRRCEFKIMCRAGHPLTQLPKIAFSDLLEFPWVGVNIPTSIQPFLPQSPKPFGVIDKAAGLAWPRIRVETFAAIQQIVLSGDALAGVPDVLVDKDENAVRLASLPVNLPWLGLNYGFIRRKGRTPSPAARAFMDIVRGIEADLDKNGGNA